MIRAQRYFKFRYRNRLYTRARARELGTTALSEDGKDLHVVNGGWDCIMHLQECAYGQKYVEEDGWLRRRDKQILRILAKT